MYICHMLMIWAVCLSDSMRNPPQWRRSYGCHMKGKTKNDDHRKAMELSRDPLDLEIFKFGF